jgi:DNA polymerase
VNTHRYSGASGAGGNPQNLPRGSALRAAVTVPPGAVLAVADFAAVELRIVAWLAREAKLIAILSDRKGDPYSAFATKIYHRIITKEDKAERQYGKCAVLGSRLQHGP